ncbi:unnamed protein product [Nippostrongylus brasiliensis]|uniref:NRF domain-containing protein n=1 Tax=Nippostrongylus brasiliensis TaxID=27835 RepID=A0A158R3D4_NIPBR|nr:unnamed protein product [Nippostrongylus brasiliensis]
MNCMLVFQQFTEFKDYHTLAASGVSAHCVIDVAELGNAARRFFTTAALCVKNGGCTDEENKVLKENMFAAKELDAFGKLPAGIFEATLISSGSYYECMDVDAPYDTQYCYARITLSNIVSLYQMVETQDNPIVKMGAKIAVCVPESCNEKGTPIFVTEWNCFKSHSGHPTAVSNHHGNNTYGSPIEIPLRLLCCKQHEIFNGILDIHLTPRYLLPAHLSHYLSQGYWRALVAQQGATVIDIDETAQKGVTVVCFCAERGQGILAVFVVWAVLATLADYVMDMYPPNDAVKTSSVANKKKKKKKKEEEEEEEEASFRYQWVRAFLAFSFYSSTASILDTRPPKEGSLRSLACIRFISMSWVAAGHTLGESAYSESFGPVRAAANPLPSTTFTNAFLSVDTFFLLSGVLVSYLFFKNRPSSRYVKNPFTWVLFYVHRYLRLTPPLMMFIALYTVTVKALISGPWAASIAGINNDFGAKVCRKYWWRNLLYINNFFGTEKDCYGISWYLAVDTQLYVAAPVFLIALYISPFAAFIRNDGLSREAAFSIAPVKLKASNRLPPGMAFMVLCCAASVAYTYAITFSDDLPAILFGIFAFPKINEFFDIFYQMPWTRCPPYLIGIGLGYLLANAKAKKPRLHWLIIVAAWLVAVAVGLVAVYTPHDYIKGDDNWSKFVRATYNNFSRIGWALAVSWVIAANHLGWGGPVAPFMDHALWQPLGKLSYCAYIVHFYVILYVFNLDDRPMHFVSLWDSYVYRAIPVIVLSYALALVWSCLFEVPTTKLEKMLIAAITPTNGRVHPTADKKTQPRPLEDGGHCEKTEDLRL